MKDEAEQTALALAKEHIVRDLACTNAIREYQVEEEMHVMPGWPTRKITATIRECIFCGSSNGLKGQPIKHCPTCVWLRARKAMKMSF